MRYIPLGNSAEIADKARLANQLQTVNWLSFHVETTPRSRDIGSEIKLRGIQTNRDGVGERQGGR